MWKLSHWNWISKYNLSFVNMQENTLYHSPCFLILVWSKANSTSDNPCDQWMIIVIVNWIENGIWDWFLSILMSLIIGSIGVQPSWIYIVSIKVNRLLFSYHFYFWEWERYPNYGFIMIWCWCFEYTINFINKAISSCINFHT